MSAQALHQRIQRAGEGAEKFMLHCLNHVLEQSRPSAPKLNSPFDRVLVQDSSFVWFDKRNSESFPGLGSRKKASSAGIKVDLTFDLLSGSVINSTLHKGTAQDKKIGRKILAEATSNDLTIRDLGYFSVDSFIEIGTRNGYWVSRIACNVHAFDKEGRALDLILRSTIGDVIDIEVTLTKVGIPCRLFAIRASKNEADKRKRARRAEAKKKGKDPSRSQLLRDEWHILVTNVPVETASATMLSELYRQRWRIEILFRGWKQSLCLERAFSRRSSDQHLKMLMLAAVLLLAIQTTTAISLLMHYPDKRPSLEKIAKNLSLRIMASSSITQISTKPIDPRHVCAQRRNKRKSLTDNLFQLLH